jgi:CheY-like chemotaxis protein
MTDGTVMVVEDDPLMREIIVQILACEGFTTIVARNGAEALRRLRDEHVHPALILLDVTMPVMNGVQFRAEQLSDSALAGIPVVIMSASGEADVSAEAHIGKSFDIDVLLDVVSRFASGPHPACRARYR